MRLPDTGPWSLGLGFAGTCVGFYLAYKQYCGASYSFADCATLSEDPEKLGVVAFPGFVGWLIGVMIDTRDS